MSASLSEVKFVLRGSVIAQRFSQCLERRYVGVFVRQPLHHFFLKHRKTRVEQVDFRTELRLLLSSTLVLVSQYVSTSKQVRWY